jgi:hypothetical protein
VTVDLTVFWQSLETNFPLGGPRRHIRELLGGDLAIALEQAGMLVQRHVADRYPCPRAGGDGCPRQLIEREDGSVVAVCGNEPAECADVELTVMDIEVVAVVPETLAEASGKALQIRTNVETLSGIRHGYRVGTFMPEAGIKHAIYFLARCSGREYAEALDALRTHAVGQTFAVLLPTDRFVTEDLRRQVAVAGIPLVSLEDAVGLDAQGGLCALSDPLKVFGGIARSGIGASEVSGPVVANALVRDGGGAPTWRSLDDVAYQSLVAAVSAYDVFADELAKTVAKRKGTERATNVPASQFKMIRAAVEKKANYDPGTADDDGVAAKQIFQRARQAFDLKTGTTWAIFKTDKVDNHAVYRFDPDASVSFAFVFAPKA